MTPPADHGSTIYDPRRPEVRANPYPVWRRLRENDPVHWSPVLRGWVLTRYRDVRAALFDPRLSADRITPFLDSLAEEDRARLSGLARLLTRWAVFVDPPDHTRLRGLMNLAFTSRALEALSPRVAVVVDRLIDGFVDQAECDLIADFAYPLPATVIAGLLGVPDADIGRFKGWSDDLSAFVGSAQAMPDKYARATRGIGEMDAYFRAIIRARKASSRQADLIGDLIAAEEGGRALSEDELVATAVLVLFAGHETTTNLIANGVLALLAHGGELAKLRGRPELFESAVEEFLRYDGPAAIVTRVAIEDVEIDGVEIARGDRLFLGLNAANRDPQRFADPDRLDIERRDNRHLAFGHGPHFCIGAPLARLEARIAFRRLLARLDDIALATEPLEWIDNLVLRGVARLPVRFTPRPTR